MAVSAPNQPIDGFSTAVVKPAPSKNFYGSNSGIPNFPAATLSCLSKQHMVKWLPSCLGVERERRAHFYPRELADRHMAGSFASLRTMSLDFSSTNRFIIAEVSQYPITWVHAVL